MTHVMAVREYFLRSPRLGFSIWTHADLPLAFELWGDPEATRLTGGPFTAQKVRERLEREINNHEEHWVQYWPIFLLETGKHVGCCGLQPHKPTEGIYELGFQLHVESIYLQQYHFWWHHCGMRQCDPKYLRTRESYGPKQSLYFRTAELSGMVLEQCRR